MDYIGSNSESLKNQRSKTSVFKDTGIKRRCFVVIAHLIFKNLTTLSFAKTVKVHHKALFEFSDLSETKCQNAEN